MAGNMPIETRLNGALMQQASTRSLIFGIQEILSDLNQYMPLEPGDIILTGTPEGVGFARRPPVFLQAGDQIEIHIPPIGKLVNSVVNEPRTQGGAV
jgi:2-keto-4-pentenoate hydratase/2-oxohepta-3-ene-1,7-dioic acid hydratase in catechol pathway